jgi:protein ImuA
MFDPLQIPNVWRAESLRAPQGVCVPSTFASFDDALGGGWPTPALIEILTDVYGIGELQLIVPLLAELVHRPPLPPLIVWLNPPYAPNAVALFQHGLRVQHWVASHLSDRDTMWSMEQALRSGACSAVLAWAPTVKSAALRRLKLAISAANGVGVLFRNLRDTTQASPANVRAALTATAAGLHVSLLKVQGRKPSEVTLNIDSRQLIECGAKR